MQYAVVSSVVRVRVLGEGRGKGEGGEVTDEDSGQLSRIESRTILITQFIAQVQFAKTTKLDITSNVVASLQPCNYNAAIEVSAVV